MAKLWHKLNKCNLWVVLILIGIYITISIFNWSSLTSTPSANWQGVKNRQIKFTFNHPTQVKYVYYYLGLANGDLHILAHDESGQQLDFGIAKTSGESPPVYQWNYLQVNRDLKLSDLTIKIESSTVQFKQILLLDPDKKVINDYKIAINYNPQSDEIDNLIAVTPPANYEPQLKSGMIYDEVYYAISAYQYLHKINLYAVNHPPLGTLLIAIGIWLFGMNTFGWRIIAYLCGIVIIPIVYNLAHRLLKTKFGAVVATLLFIFDFMHFTISRFALIDAILIIFTSCIYLTLLAYIQAKQQQQFVRARKNLYYLGLWFALGLSVKWITLFSLIAILPILFYYELWQKKVNLTQLIDGGVILVIIVLIYSLSYVPQYFNQPRLVNFVEFVWQQQIAMYHYHTGYAVTHHHFYQSKWWGWPLLLRPQKIYASFIPNSSEYFALVLMGNPAIWWFSIVAVMLILINWFKNRDWRLAFILLALASLYLPYALVQRTSFIYYLYEATPFMVIAIASVLENGIKRSEVLLRGLVWFYLFIVIALFILFYPVLSGLVVERLYIYKYLLWFQGWQF
jgi:dolichyl-phosphate-mannose--protein O-mannosyl transferase